jgi:hypothetical protein
MIPQKYKNKMFWKMFVIKLAIKDKRQLYYFTYESRHLIL